MQPGARKAGGVEQERAPHSKSSSRSHHVEVVLERILARRQVYPKQKPPRSLDWEDLGRNWH
jgi:hypothetical protein